MECARTRTRTHTHHRHCRKLVSNLGAEHIHLNIPKDIAVQIFKPHQVHNRQPSPPHPSPPPFPPSLLSSALAGPHCPALPRRAHTPVSRRVMPGDVRRIFDSLANLARVPIIGLLGLVVYPAISVQDEALDLHIGVRFWGSGFRL
jgi:hypothetical protein